MSATMNAQSGPQRKRETIHIYIDNSNLWIQGQKTYAEKHGLAVKWDPTWRFDVGQLREILLKKSTASYAGEESDVKTNLYGSTPPPIDTVWRAIEAKEVEVFTFGRSSWTRREKEVDAEIITHSVEDASNAYHQAIPSEFMIVSGDRDLHRAALSIAKRGFKVHVWSWKNALSNVYDEPPKPELARLIEVHLLDGHLEEIGFKETTFRVDRRRISPQSIVVFDPWAKADEVNELVSSLRIPLYRYIEGEKDLIIIFAVKLKDDDHFTLFQEIQQNLQAHDLTVMTYQEYSQGNVESQSAVLSVSNRFNPLHVDESSENEDSDENDGFIAVDSYQKKQNSLMKKDEQKLGSHCKWRIYCTKGLNCKWGHTDDEKRYFLISGPKTARKVKPCKNAKDCTYGTRCSYAHEGEIFCPTCGKTGEHEMSKCPQSVRKSRGY